MNQVETMHGGNRVGPRGPNNRETESRRLQYRLRRKRFSDMAVFPGERESTVDHTLARHLAEREKQVEKLTSDNAALRDLALRARAELDNARKRLEREKAETVKFANERLVAELLGVLDNLERAFGSAADTEETKPLRDGIQMVLDQFLGILTSNGLEVIAPDGQHFNPHFHEAVAAEERDDVEDQTVLETFQKGYVLRGRVIRPAMVRVAQAVRRAEPAPAIDPDREETLADVEEGEGAALEGAEQPGIVEVVDVPAEEKSETDEDRGDETRPEPGVTKDDPDVTEDSEVSAETPPSEDVEKS